MFIICNYDWLAAGTMVDVSFELEPGSKFACRMEIRYADDGCCGGLIVDADAESKTHLEKFILANFSHQEHLPERRKAR